MSVTGTTVGKGAEHERGPGTINQTHVAHGPLANKHRCILGKDLGHGKWILLSLSLNPPDTQLSLRKLAILVLFALLLPSRGPNKRRRYKFCLVAKTKCFKYNKAMISAPAAGPAKEIIVPGLANTVAPPKAPSNMRIGVSTKRGPISTSDISGAP